MRIVLRVLFVKKQMKRIINFNTFIELVAIYNLLSLFVLISFIRVRSRSLIVRTRGLRSGVMANPLTVNSSSDVIICNLRSLLNL